MRKIKSDKKKIWIVFLLILITFTIMLYEYKNIIGPNIDDISVIKSRSLLNELINETLIAELDKVPNKDNNFLKVNYDEN